MAVPGLTGLQGFEEIQPEADPAELQGGPANPKHEDIGETARPYPWQSTMFGIDPSIPHGPYGPGEDALLGQPVGTLAAGELQQDPTGDETPYLGHAAPYPIESPSVPMADQSALGNWTNQQAGSSRQLEESRNLHSADTGAALAREYDPTLDAKQDEWVGFYDVMEGQDNVQGATGAVSASVGGFGTNDHASNSYKKENEYGFNAAHAHRRYATGPIPGNHMWMRPGSRPLQKHIPTTANLPVGQGSPFEGDDTGASYGIQGAVLQDIPGEYIPPTEPLLANPQPVQTAESIPTIPFW